PGVNVTQGNEDSAHNFFGYHSFFPSRLVNPVYYAVIAHPSGNGVFYSLNEFQTLTKTASHELAEAVTDPGVGGWYDGRNGEEIGDLANGPRDIGLLSGYVVQAEWSARLRAVVLPSGAQALDATSVSAKPITSALDTVANAFTHSDEYFANLVTEDYVNLLHR